MDSTALFSLLVASLDDSRALAVCSCVSRCWRALAAGERDRLRAVYERALGEENGRAFIGALFSRADPQATRQAGWCLSARHAYATHRRRCLAALCREADDAAPELGRGANLLAAHEFVQGHAHLFRAPVYGPLLTELAFAEPWHAACIADAVPPFLWLSFLVSTDEDNDLLCQHLARFGACVARLPAELSPEEALVLDEPDAALGARWCGDASALVQAPPLVLRALCDVGGLRTLAVAEAEDVAQAAQLLRRSAAPALLAVLPATALTQREAWRLCAAPRAGEPMMQPLSRCARVPDAPPHVLAALGRRADWCRADEPTEL